VKRTRCHTKEEKTEESIPDYGHYNTVGAEGDDESDNSENPFVEYLCNLCSQVYSLVKFLEYSNETLENKKKTVSAIMRFDQNIAFHRFIDILFTNITDEKREYICRTFFSVVFKREFPLFLDKRHETGQAKRDIESIVFDSIIY